MATQDDIQALEDAARSAQQAAEELEGTTQRAINSILNAVSSADQRLVAQIEEIATQAQQAIISTGVENLQQISQIAQQRARQLEEALG